MFLTYIALALIGAIVGGFVNASIYGLGRIKRGHSPWSAPPEGVAGREWADRIPIWGWLRLRRDANVIGKGFWKRPLGIELSWLLGLPLFYAWQHAGGLTGGVTPPPNWPLIWFVGHSLLIVHLYVATFIDFDERIIPDLITIPGTLIGLIIAAAFPSFRLPEIVANLQGSVVAPVDFCDAQNLGTWHFDQVGLGLGLAVFAIWIVALLPKHPLERLNLHSLKFVVASTIRFLQYKNLKTRRYYNRVGRGQLAIGLVGLIALALAWTYLPPLHWTSLFGSLVGMGFGGLTVWSIRIVGSHSLGREAMGFGDVTLMAMIGAFVGWQASLIIFALSPFAALAVVLVNFLLTGESELAFGPYLCFSTLIAFASWANVWPWARVNFFLFPITLIIVLAFSLVLLMLMMLAVRKLKEGSLAREE